MPEPGAAPYADRSPGGPWGLSSGVQPTQAAQPIGPSQPGGLRQDSKSIPGSGRAPPFLHRGWTFRSEPTTFNQRLKLSHPLEQFLRSCQSLQDCQWGSLDRDRRGHATVSAQDNAGSPGPLEKAQGPDTGGVRLKMIRGWIQRNRLPSASVHGVSHDTHHPWPASLSQDLRTVPGATPALKPKQSIQPGPDRCSGRGDIMGFMRGDCCGTPGRGGLSHAPSPK